MTNEPGTPDASEQRDEVAHSEQPGTGSQHVTVPRGTRLIYAGPYFEAYTWVVLTVPLLPFLNSFMSKAGEDAYRALKQFVRHRLKTEERDRLILEDADTHICVVVTAELPDEAF